MPASRKTEASSRLATPQGIDTSQRPGDTDQAMTIGIGLDDTHNLTAGGQFANALEIG